MTERPWIVVRTHPRRERWAAENIVKQGCEVYSPQYTDVVVSRGSRVVKVQPLFPSYVFARHPELRWRFLLSTFGVAGIVLVGSEPAYIADAEIERLRLREVDGVVELPKLKHGDAVRVKSGSFAGHVGLYDKMTDRDRQAVLLDLLGGRRRVLISDELLERDL
jgi:transcriptional antiterminator RfaH